MGPGRPPKWVEKVLSSKSNSPELPAEDEMLIDESPLEDSPKEPHTQPGGERSRGKYSLRQKNPLRRW